MLNECLKGSISNMLRQLISMHLTNHFKLSKRLCPTTDEEKEKIVFVPYSSLVGSCIYAMVCILLDIGQIVGLVSGFLSDPGNVGNLVARKPQVLCQIKQG